ncbi:recombinase family protein [Streptomyces gelaticus]
MTTTQEPPDEAGDTLVVPSPDRFGRSLQDLVNMVAEPREREDRG